MFSTASGFSILAIIGILWSECLAIKSCNSSRSLGVLTNESAIQSTLFSIANKASLMSFCVNAGKDTFVLGKFTPFLDFNGPP